MKKYFILSLLLLARPVSSDDMTSAYGETVKLAVGYEQLIKKSPSTISLITASDIKNIGATSIEEVLETVPGIHVSYVNGFYPTYTIRGVGSTTNTPVLIYLDGISINSSVLSTSYFSLGHLTGNIEKIEIIKGPGSSLYGADAFSGVINIITKNKAGIDINGFAGSFDTYGGSLNYGVNVNDLNFNFSAQGMTTNGSNDPIEKDRQSFIDQIINTNNSLAPGSINRGKEEFDIKFSAKYKEKGSLYLRYIRKETQNGVGTTNSLDNIGSITTDAWITGFKTNFKEKNWETTLDLSYTGYILDAHHSISPKGTLIGAPNEPALNYQKYTSHDLSSKLSTIYQGLNNHVVFIGVGFEYDIVGDIVDKRNFTQGPFNSLLSSGSLQNTKELGIEAFAGDEYRHNAYGFIQDEWAVLNDLTLTTGVRFDYFSDFGLTVNPRASLIWDVSSSMTTKIMYGRAFRAPSFFELYSNAGATVTGNSDLNPETIETIELTLLKDWSNGISTQLNLFWHQTDDLITEEILIDRLTQSQSRQFINSGGSNTYGLELDFNYPIKDNLNLDVNYSFLNINPINDQKDKFIITAPRHQIYAAINWDINSTWSTNLRSTSVIDRKRSHSDNRSKIKNYTKIDFTLHANNINNLFDITFKVNNIFNANVKDPSVDPISIPSDYPLDDRSYMGIISVKF